MVVNGIIGILIFAYAAWTIFRLIKKSRQGKCAACTIKQECPSVKRMGGKC